MNRFTTKQIEKCFQTSLGNDGDLVDTGPHGHLVSWRLNPLTRQFYIPLTDQEKCDATEHSWQSNGFRCYTSKLRFQSSGRMCVIECYEPEFFTLMSRLVATMIEEEVIGAARTIELFRLHREFWLSERNEISETSAAGIFGEIFLMRHHLSSELKYVFSQNAWGGNNNTDKDINLPELQIEVKTTCGSQLPVRHTISSLHQLTPQDRPLILFSLRAHPDLGGEWSLRTLVAETENLLSTHNLTLLDRFRAQLGAFYEYLNNPINEDFRFTILNGSGEFYAVNDHFPRMSQQDLPADNRIVILSYDLTLVDVDACKLKVSCPLTISDLVNAYHSVAH